MTAKTFEDFKKNLGQLERTLADDSVEPTNDLKIMETWLDYVERNAASADETVYILKEWIPRITKTIMSRKFDWSRTTYTSILPFVEHLVTFAVKYLPEDHEGIYVALRDLLDPAMPFFAKYCSLKSDAAELADLPALVDVPPLANPDALTAGDYVDCLSKSNKWEYVTIERFTEYRTEFEVQWQDGHREWLSLERDRHRLATFMTKSEEQAGSSAATTGTTTPIPHSSGASVIDVTDTAWKDVLEVGDLVDVRDPNQVWYQACIMDLKQETVTTVDGPFSAPRAKLILVTAPAAVIDRTQPTEMAQSDSLDDLYDHNLSANTAKTMTVEPASADQSNEGPIIEEPDEARSAQDSAGISNNMLIDENPIDFTEDADRASMTQKAEYTVTEVPDAAPAFAAPTITARSLARIAYIGMPERCDEWIEVSNDRIQQVNTCSFGRRGKLIGVREEILHLVKLVPSQQGEIDKFAIYREGCFVLPVYIQMVNLFGKYGGFDVIIEKLRLAHTKISATITAPASMDVEVEREEIPTQGVAPATTLTGLLNLVTAVGPMHRVLTKSFLASFGLPFLELSSAILMELSLADIRETPVEAIEPALNALEQIALAHFGQNAATGKVIDPLKLEVALQSLRSPFLNRRLGGLKILSELIRRGENSRDFPTGLRVIRSMANGEEELSFKVMPVLFHHTLHSICEKLRNDDCITQLFVGDNAHESLMSRSGPVVSAMAGQQCLESPLLNAMWTAGFMDRKPEALQCLSRVVSSLPLSDPHVHVLLKSIRSVDSAALTSSVVDIVGALGMRCRDALLTGGELANQEAETCFALSAQMEETALFQESQMDVVDNSTANAACNVPETPLQQLRSAFHTHTQALLTLWRWTLNISGVSDGVVSACLSKIESILQLGVTTPDALRNPDFPWAMHWFRMSTLVDEAVQSVRRQDSLFSAVKMLQLAICSWPSTSSPGMSAGFPPVANLPFPLPHRGDAMVYLQINYQLTECITAAAVQLKEHFNTQVLVLAKAAAWGAQVDTIADLSSVVVLTAELEEKLNMLKLPESRQGYLEQLSQLLDFLHMSVRCGESLEIPRSTIFNLWEAVILAPVTADEVDVIISFCHRIVTVASVTVASAASASASSHTTAPTTTAATSSTAEPPRRTSVSSREVVIDAFTNLLCKKTGFLQSRFFSGKAFSCAEKWFRWLNAGFEQQNKIASDQDQCLQKQADHPAKLIGIDVFANIILTCHSDKVATSAVKFLTMLPQTLAHWSRNAPSAVAFRKMLLSLCMGELSSSVAASQAKSSMTGPSSGTISRSLLFLDGILEESLNSTGGAVSLHGTIGRGVPVTFMVSSTTKCLKEHDGEVVLYMNETVSDLFRAVAQQMQLSVPEIKIYRLGKEITLKTEGEKVISQLRGIIVGEKDRLVVAKHPLPKKIDSEGTVSTQASDSVASPTADATKAACSPKSANSNECDEKEATAALPVLVLSQTPEYFNLLFNLLQSSTGEVCDRVWSLISRIPTSSAVLDRWVSLDCDEVSLLLVAADAHSAGKLSTLLYNLQVIEMLLQPAVSAADLEVQCKYIRDIDHALLISFAERFVTKRGFAALCQALTWVSAATQSFLSQPPVEDLPGVTPHLLQSASSLITKMLRGFVVRICARQSDVHAASMEAILRDLKTSEGICKDVTKLYFKDSQESPPSKPADAAPVMVDLTNTAAPAVLSTPAGNLLDSEWGWRVGSFEDMVITQCDPLSTTLSALEVSVVQQLVLLRKLCEHSYFNASASADATVTSAKLTKRIELVGSLDHLLVLWTAATLTTSTDALSVDAYRIVNELVLGNVALGDNATAAHNAIHTNEVAHFFVEIVLYFIHWVSRHSAGAATVPRSSETHSAPSTPIEHFVVSVITSILSLRPSLTENASASAGKSAYKPLFDLAAGLFNGPFVPQLVLPAEVVTNSCTQILSELRIVAAQLRAAADSDGSTAKSNATLAFPDLVGTMMLLAALCVSDRDNLGAGLLQQDNVLDFLLYECLGLVGLPKCGVPIVCSDETARKYMYTLLKDLVQRSVARAQGISHTLAALHQEVPPPTAWDYRPQRESRSSTGYVGLRNLGSTCYMNSLLQVLFMNSAVREYILHEIHFDTESEDQLRNNLACQLQKMFIALKYSQKRFYSPTDWTFAFKDEMGINPMDVMIQQDAQEFLQLLSDRFERCIQEHHHQSSQNTASVDILHQTFGGLICNQMFKTNSDLPPAGALREIREQNEGFMCISLDVKGCENLEKSLAKFVEGEQISGYLWEDGQPRENITKRQCIASIPDALIFHLKRFELNFDTFRREKVNDAFAFPLRINMHPYTKEGLLRAESGANSTDFDTAEYECELSGVIVHTGTTESGHYFAYIKEQSSTGPAGTDAQPARWCEFNDSEVSNFSVANLEKECFGGVCKTHDLYSGGASIVTHESVNPKSAYMLIYNRVKKSSPATTMEVSTHNSIIADPPVVHIGSVIEKFKAQIELENAHQSLSTRILNEQHLTFANDLLDALHRHAAEQGELLRSEQLSSYVEFVTQYVAHTAHSAILRTACENIQKYLVGHKALAVKNAAARNVVGGASAFSVPSHSRLLGGTVVAPPTSSPTFARRPPTPPSISITAAGDNKENESALPPPPPPVDAASPQARATAVVEGVAEVVEVPAPPVSDLILANWLRNVDTELAGVYAPKEEVRKSISELAFRVFEVGYIQHGKAVFSDSSLDMNTGLLSTSFGAGMLAVAALATTAASVFSKPKQGHANSIYTIPEGMEVAEAEPIDEDLLLAIKMSQEMADAAEVSPVPTTASIAEPSNHVTEKVRPPSPVEVTEIPPLISTSAVPTVPQSPVVTPPHLLAPNFLLALTNDVRLQLIAEHWRKSQSMLWLLLESARLGAAVRHFMLKREVVAQLVDIFLGDQCPLSGMVYAVGSRRRAPSSYITVVPGRDGSLPYVARNIPDWTHLVELLSALVCQSDSLQLSQSMGEVSFQCVQVKTLYSTLLRQARYIAPAMPMIIHLSFENKPISDMIGEAFCEELSLSNYDSTAHIFQAMERFLNINDTLAHQRNFQLFGGGDYNLLETMNISKDQPAKQRLVCVFIRSFIALIDSSPTLRTVVSVPLSKVNHWAPWMLKFCFRFSGKCSREQADSAAPVADSDKQKLNAAIERACDTVAKDISSPSTALRNKKPASAVGSGTVAAAPPDSSPLLSKGPFLRVFGEDPETESTQTWVQRAEKTSQMLYTMLTSLGASPDALLPVDTFDEDTAVSGNNAPSGGNASGNSVSFGPSTAAVHPMPLTQAQAQALGNGGGNSVAFPQFADGMSDEELAQLLQDGALGTEID